MVITHGGEITLEAKGYEGIAAFLLKLPRITNGHPGQGKNMEKPRQILVVEDEIMHSRLFTTILTRLGYIVETAFDGITGLEKAVSSPPDLILLDLNLPRMDGYEVARRLKRDDKTKIIPIVVVSAFSEVENRVNPNS